MTSGKMGEVLKVYYGQSPSLQFTLKPRRREAQP